MDEVYNCSNSEEHFCGVFENNPFKITSIIFAVLAMPVCVSLLYGIIWYEKFGTDQMGTLGNKLLSSLCWSSIFGILVCYLDIIRYVIGPLPHSACFFITVARNAFKTQIVLFYDAILVTRYVFIFWIKNPGGVDDDFWCRFLSIWITGFSTLLNFVFFTLPARQPMFYFVCADIDLTTDLAKNNKPSAIIEIISIIMLIIIKVRIYIHKTNHLPIEPVNIFHKSYVLPIIENQNIVDFTSNLIGLLCLIGFSLLNIKINSMTLFEINQFPHYLYLFLFQMICPGAICLIAVLINYYRFRNLRETLKRELKEYFKDNLVDCID
jgi:hypothetical protein